MKLQTTLQMRNRWVGSVKPGRRKLEEEDKVTALLLLLKAGTAWHAKLRWQVERTARDGQQSTTAPRYDTAGGYGDWYNIQCTHSKLAD